MQAEHKIRLVEQARSAIEMFGVEERIGWTGFLRMITREPWRQLLPAAAQSKIPRMLLQHQRQQQVPSPACGDAEAFWQADSAPAQSDAPAVVPVASAEQASATPTSPKRRPGGPPKGMPPAYSTEGQRVCRLPLGRD